MKSYKINLTADELARIRSALGQAEITAENTPLGSAQGIRALRDKIFFQAEKQDEESRTAEELQATCDSIREELEALYNADFTDEERERREEEGEPCDFYDYFGKALDHEFIVASTRDYVGCRVYMTLGGPTVYIDTCAREVVGHWGSDTARAWLPSEICDEIDEVFESIYNN